jgi:hypothetical protein
MDSGIAGLLFEVTFVTGGQVRATKKALLFLTAKCLMCEVVNWKPVINNSNQQ